MRRLSPLIYIGQIASLKVIEASPHTSRLGAACTYEEMDPFCRPISLSLVTCCPDLALVRCEIWARWEAILPTPPRGGHPTGVDRAGRCA